jgi:hypothetical protein
MRDIIKERTLFAGFVPGRNDRLVTSGKDGWIRQWQVANDEIREIDSERARIPDVAIDWVGFSDDDTEMLAVGEDRVVYVIDRRSHQVMPERGDGRNIDWAAARTVPLQPVELRTESASASDTIPLPQPDQPGARSLQAGGRTWLVVARSGPNDSTSYKTYLVEGDHAVTFAGLELNAEAIEQFGDLFWIKSRPALSSDPPSGPVLRVDGAAFFYRKSGVRAVVAYQNDLFLAADHLSPAEMRGSRTFSSSEDERGCSGRLDSMSLNGITRSRSDPSRRR